MRLPAMPAKKKCWWKNRLFIPISPVSIGSVFSAQLGTGVGFA
jgi:hypothetical protein